MAVLQSQLRLSLLDQVTAPIRKMSGTLAAFQRQTMGFANPLRGAIGQLAAFGGAYLGVTEGVKATIGSAIEFESAFADVRKVVDASDEQFGNMARTIKSMSRELPLTSVEIAQLFAAAGESGIATNELKSFAEMAARVGIAFDMSADQAGTNLAKLKTQLGLSLAETGDLADAINHLSNNMASKASDITDFMLRISALGKMGGFTAEQLAGMGSAMIAAGAPAEVAGTAMQNVVKALTKGKFAKKEQRDAAAALGLDLPTIAKQMQKDAPKALKTVLKAIAKAPKDQHIAILSQFFGDEAKAFAPLIGNVALLDQALDSVSDRAKYSGSAFQEYAARASTTGNALQILRNKINYVFEDMGERMLPTVKEGVAAIGEVLDTLGERASIFDEMEASIMGFAQGLGYSGVKDVIADLGDLFFGKVDGTAGDQLGRLFMQAKGWGETIRELSAAIKENPIAQFFADLAPYGFQIMAWGLGISFLAGMLRKLAAALMLVSGASTVVAALKAAGSIAAIVGGGGATAATAGAGAAGAAAAGSAGAGVGWMAKLLGMARLSMLGGAAAGAYTVGSETYTGDTPYSRGLALMPSPTDVAHDIGSYISSIFKADGGPGFLADRKLQDDQFVQEWQRLHGSALASDLGGSDPQKPDMYTKRFLDALPPIAYDPVVPSTRSWPSSNGQSVRIDASSIAAMSQPNGVQSVLVTNQQPPNVKVENHFTITGVSDPHQAASSAASQLGGAVKSAVEGTYSD